MQNAEIISFSAEWIAANVYSLATALIVFLAGWFAADLLSRWTRASMGRIARIDRTIAPILAQLVRYGILAVTLVIVLGQFGVQTASILAVLGAIGLAVALALQGTLSNMAAGIMLLWLRPFNAGEYIDGEGIAGTVAEIGLFGTWLTTYDGVAVFAPNSRLWNAKIVNYTRQKTRMVETRVGISYGASIEKARITLLGVARELNVNQSPEPQVFVDGLGASSINLVLRAWVSSPDWWRSKIALMERTKTALDAAGIEIPFDQLDLHVRSMPDQRNALSSSAMP